MSHPRTVGLLIEAELNRRGMNPNELAKLANVSTNTVRYTISETGPDGKRQVANKRTLFKIAQALDLDPRPILIASGAPQRAIDELLDAPTHERIDVSDLDLQDQILAKRIVDAIRAQPKYQSEN